MRISNHQLAVSNAGGIFRLRRIRDKTKNTNNGYSLITKPDVGHTEIADADSFYRANFPFAIIEIIRVANAIFIMIKCAASEGSICFDRNRGNFGPI